MSRRGSEKRTCSASNAEQVFIALTSVDAHAETNLGDAMRFRAFSLA
jgi:hypothetical protein